MGLYTTIRQDIGVWRYGRPSGEVVLREGPVTVYCIGRWKWLTVLTSSPGFYSTSPAGSADYWRIELRTANKALQYRADLYDYDAAQDAIAEILALNPGSSVRDAVAIIDEAR